MQSGPHDLGAAGCRVVDPCADLILAQPMPRGVQYLYHRVGADDQSLHDHHPWRYAPPGYPVGHDRLCRDLGARFDLRGHFGPGHCDFDRLCDHCARYAHRFSRVDSALGQAFFRYPRTSP